MVAENKTEKTLDPNSKINPSTGLLARNPTRTIEDADNQREIVEQVREARAGRKRIVYSYQRDEKGEWEFSGLPGTVSIREMDEKQLTEYFRNLMRSRPNVIGLRLSLGDYEDKKPYNGPRVDKLQFTKPRLPTNVAEDMAALLSLSSPSIVELEWQINSAGEGNFYTSAKAFAVSEESYENDELFQPHVEIEYVQFD